MALTIIQKNLGDGGSHLGRNLYTILKELQNRKTVTAVGAAANTNITLTGAKVGDTILGVVNLTDGASLDVSTFSVTGPGVIQSTASTAGKNLLVDWAAKP